MESPGGRDAHPSNENPVDPRRLTMTSFRGLNHHDPYSLSLGRREKTGSKVGPIVLGRNKPLPSSTETSQRPRYRSPWLYLGGTLSPLPIYTSQQGERGDPLYFRRGRGWSGIEGTDFSR